MEIFRLEDNWTLRAIGEAVQVPDTIRQKTVPAAVPGCVHTALLDAGLIPDPYTGDAEEHLRWIGETDWEYRCTFEAPSRLLRNENIELVCEGLDTIASLELNDRLIGRCEDMHFEHVFDVASAITEGENTLRILFRAPLPYARAKAEELGELPRVNDLPPFNFIRKMACNFGWDWGPQLTTAGPWKPISLRGWGSARLQNVRPWVVLANAEDAQVDVLVDIDRAEAGWLGVTATLEAPDGQAFSHQVALREENAETFVRLDVHEPQLWWPRGYGEQPLYTLKVTLRDREGRRVLDEWVGRIGLRTVDLDTSEDDAGSRFALRVNGREIFCKGANWIPDDCFLDRACTPERYRAAIANAVDTEMNMLRVWGGGIFETDAFYDICDELGVMVWQDFLFACASYPEEQPFADLVEQEARFNVARLMPHPSLVLWNGCNENLWGYCDWGWKERGWVEGRTWGAGYYLELLPRIVAQVDPSRPYWPASPYSGQWKEDQDPEFHPNANPRGNTHIWHVWFGDDYSAYRQDEPRFCSEFGFQAPPTFATLSEALAADQLRRGSEGLAHRQRSGRGDERNDRHLEAWFNMPANFDDWHYLLQVNQARALTTGVEWFRSRQPRCMGTLYWQLNDCWPVTSWSAVDGAGRKKPLWYATRRFYADRLLTIQPGEGGLMLFAINDTDEPWSGEAVLWRTSFTGETLAESARQLEVPARSCLPVERLDSSLVEADDPTRELLVAEAAGARATWFFSRDKHLHYPEPELDAEVSPDEQGCRVTLKARTLVRDFCLQVDRLDPRAEASDQLITLLPGESREISIHSPSGVSWSAETLLTPPVGQCVNRFGAR